MTMMGDPEQIFGPDKALESLLELLAEDADAEVYGEDGLKARWLPAMLNMNTESKLGPHTQTDRGTCPGVGL